MADATLGDAEIGDVAIDDVTVDRVRDAVLGRREAFLRTLVRLARIETPSTNPDVFAPAFRLLADELSDAGMSLTHLPGTDTAGSLYARPASRAPASQRSGPRPVQLMIGHVDTVWPLGTLDRMPVEQARTGTATHLRGPGVFDMKAGLVSILTALRVVQDLGLSLPADPVVLISSDEEIGSHDSRRHIERLARCASRVFVTEPGLGLDGKIKTARKGTGEYALTVHPPSSNDDSSGPDVVATLMELVRRLHELNDPAHGITVNVGTVRGPTAADATGALGLDVRVVTAEDVHQVDHALREIADDATLPVEVHGGVDRPPLERTPGNQRLWHAAREIGERLGLSLDDGRSGGASDGNFTSLHAPTLDGLGAVGDGAHADHEFIDIDATLQRCALLTLLLVADVREGAYEEVRDTREGHKQ